MVAELGKISAAVDHFTTFAVLASYSPPAFKLSNLSITPSSEYWRLLALAERTGETVTITLDVMNNGGQQGTYTAILKVNGKIREVKVISLEPGQTQNIDFIVAGNEPGSYLVEIGDLSGEFESALWIKWWLISGFVVASAFLLWLIRYVRKRRKRLL